MTFSLLKGLSRFKEFELFVVVLNSGKLSQKIQSLGIPVFIIEEHKYSFFKLVLQIKKIVQHIAPDIVHSHRYKENLISFINWKFHPGCRLIATQHGMPEEFGKNKIKAQMVNHFNFLLLSFGFDKMVVVSGDMKKKLIRKYGFNKNDIDVIRNGVGEVIAKAEIKDKKFVIGSAGRLSPIKDYPLLIEIAKAMVKVNDQVIFKLAGDGPEKSRLCHMVQRYGLEKQFEFLGQLEDMEAFYNTLDVYLNTSLHEGIPMTILEAMARGIPVVAPDVGGIREIIQDGADGFMVKERDASNFAEKCLYLCREKKVYRKMSICAVKKIEEKFTMHHMADQYYQLYLNKITAIDL